MKQRTLRVLLVALLTVFACVPVWAQNGSTNQESQTVAGTNCLAPDFKLPTKAELKKRLTPTQFAVTQEAQTEAPFDNEFYNNHKPGLYVDIVSGKPLFSSLDKFDSGCGWPSFSKPVNDKALVEKEDHTLNMDRTEVRSSAANSHLGHLFNDGPGPTHARYCINSASLRFIPVEEMEKEGYGAYLDPFIKAGLYKKKSK